MHDAGIPWPPAAGDYVSVTATGVTGEVTEVIGTGADQRFVVSIWPPPDSPPSATVQHRFCTVSDISPVRSP